MVRSSQADRSGQTVQKPYHLPGTVLPISNTMLQEPESVCTGAKCIFRLKSIFWFHINLSLG